MRLRSHFDRATAIILTTLNLRWVGDFSDADDDDDGDDDDENESVADGDGDGDEDTI